ncbi:MAG: amidohydrolase [Desulfobacter sp.]|nr:MAG: amidohydrolase [Desulfobacter sp.]
MAASKTDLKNEVLKATDRLAPAILDVGDFLYTHPELGYKETKATAHVAGLLEKAGYTVQKEIAVTGLTARLPEKKQGPTLALMGELDAIVCKDHPHAGPGGAVHACGHHIQAAVMAGVAMVLREINAFPQLGGNLIFMAVPAEEFVEMEFRSRLRQERKIRWFGGKQELTAKGAMDDVDMALMMHALNLPPGKKVFSASSGNGFIGKTIKFTGKEAHAGSDPDKGVNALNAAMLAINNIHAQRETFKDTDRVRIHPIITKGGDVVNVVPADVRMETYVRAGTIQALKAANAKADRALKAGAAAVGAGIEIRDIPGYLPLVNDTGLETIFQDNIAALCRPEETIQGGDFSGSLDFGDISHIMPGLHPFFGGIEGSLHSKEFRVADHDTAFLIPVKSLAMTIIDLLWGDAKAARQVLEKFTPRMDKPSYLSWLETVEKEEIIALK